MYAIITTNQLGVKSNAKLTLRQKMNLTCPTMVAANDWILYFPVIKSATFWKMAALEDKIDEKQSL